MQQCLPMLWFKSWVLLPPLFLKSVSKILKSPVHRYRWSKLTLTSIDNVIQQSIFPVPQKSIQFTKIIRDWFSNVQTIVSSISHQLFVSMNTDMYCMCIVACGYIQMFKKVSVHVEVCVWDHILYITVQKNWKTISALFLISFCFSVKFVLFCNLQTPIPP